MGNDENYERGNIKYSERCRIVHTEGRYLSAVTGVT
jgi:hypothetical protein